MLKYIFIVLASCALTFTITYVFKQQLDARQLKIGNYKAHHSFFGVFLFFVGLIINSRLGSVVSSAGLGMYIGHTIEEMYFNHFNLWQALTTFITKRKQ